MDGVSSRFGVALTVISILINVLPATAGAQAGKVWFKPKTFAESLKQDKKTCIAQGFKAADRLTTCLIDNGWTLIDKAVYEKDGYQCLEQANGGPKDLVRKSYLACMLDRGWDLETNIERELTKLALEAKQICDFEEYRMYVERSACLPTDITLEQLSDATRINEKQKIAMMGFTKAIDDVENRIEDVQRLGGMLSRKMYEYDLTIFRPAIDTCRIELFQGKLTWGEYNRRKRDAFTQRAIAIKNATEDVAAYAKSPVQ